MAAWVTSEPSYLLHSRPYRETSLLIDVFTLNHGLSGLIVKGAQRSSNPIKGVLQPFQPLLLSWRGRSELKTLTDVETSIRLSPLRGDYLYSGFYLNELLSKCLPSGDPHPQLFSAYADAMGAMGTKGQLEPILRGFEFRMLAEMGVLPGFTKEAKSDHDIEPEGHYYWRPEIGFVRVVDGNTPTTIISGAQLIELSKGDFRQAHTLRVAKHLSRAMIDQLLGGRRLKSRELIATARELKKHDPANE